MRRPAAGPVSPYTSLDAIVEDADLDEHEKACERSINPIIEDNLTHLTRIFCRSEHLSLRQRGRIATGVRQEPDKGIRMEDFLYTRCQSADRKPDCGDDGDPGITLALHLEDHDRAEGERDRSEHLVRDAEE